MGYYFSLEHTNMLSNLIDGDIKQLLYQIDKNEEDREIFMSLVNDLNQNLISTNPDRYRKYTSRILESISNDRMSTDDFYMDTSDQRILQSRFSNTTISSISDLSGILKSFDYKFLILKPRTQHDDTLEEVVLNNSYNFSGLFMQPKDILEDDNFALLNSFKHYEKLMKNLDRWPAVLIWKNQKKSFLIKLKTNRSLRDIVDCLNRYGEISLAEMEEMDSKEQINYIIHLSDLHFGAHNNTKRIERLKKIVKNTVESCEEHSDIDIVITGDSVDSPKDVNFKNFKLFVNYLSRLISKDPHIIHGNHDLFNRGISLNPSKRRKYSYINSLSGRSIIQLTNNITLMPMDSNIGGSWAQGHVGDNQLQDFERKIQNTRTEDRILIALLHHHVSDLNDITSEDWKRKKWYERLFPNYFRNSLKLTDSKEFIDWAEYNNISIVLHGHKHIPYFDDESISNALIIACGSSTGAVEHIDATKTYISYNLIKITNSSISTNLFVEDALGMGPKSINSKLIKI